MKQKVCMLLLFIATLSCKNELPKTVTYSQSIEQLKDRMKLDSVSIDSTSLKWSDFSRKSSRLSVGPSDVALLVTFKLSTESKKYLSTFDEYPLNVGFPFKKELVKDWYPPSVIKSLQVRPLKIYDAEKLKLSPYTHGFFLITEDDFVFIYMAT